MVVGLEKRTCMTDKSTETIEYFHILSQNSCFNNRCIFKQTGFKIMVGWLGYDPHRILRMGDATD